ncbi:NAD(P)-dependent oxidoreductase [Agrilactobacillus fermenti]|uniref:NAD(P)-dependent oxidoreductase n=1 Tax=Agrilactobacillus fermenti TaxID=2586909 RepID=UPI001E51B740|nr:NAD(P)-binding domain-containing protein [Agrilactobacillus fermenti]MCD2255611.1 NAD(P)-dependent oxidoreductase [Agrilactobacillus fermenti]
MKVTFIGIGDMGTQMVPHLAANGYEVKVWDKDQEKMQNVQDAHIQIAHSLEEAVTFSKLVITSVMSEDVLALHLGEPGNPGILSFLQPGSKLIITSTLDPNKIAEINQKMPAQTQVLDVPMIGGVKYAREAKLVLMAAGDEAIVRELKPVLSVFGTVKYVGALGNGAKLKLITNVAIMAAEAGIRETLDLADAYQIDYKKVLELLQLGPLKPVVLRALDESNPRPLKASVADEDELLAATKDMLKLPLAEGSRDRLKLAVEQIEGEAKFIDITNKNTSLPKYRDVQNN